MRKLKMKATALCCGAAACALLAGCAAQDGAETASARRANSAAGAANAGRPANAPQQPNPAGPRVDAHGHVDNARRVSVAELRDLLEKGEAVPVDVRSPEAYQTGHIKGAILLPSDEVKARAKELPKDKLLVFYCA
ncbi:MAG TPA: rhodanese-like domain-containing protein [Pyrinomonadaceae bacterium]|nr:rhodanese-like domain-containing protein [Pyrinomonadaceae bacterium]